jgi:hypothetical protein
MSYVDFAVAVAFFLFFFGVVLMFSTNYFSNLSALTKTSEFRPISENFFNIFFNGLGLPTDWHENTSIIPVKVGLMDYLYKVPINVKESNGTARTDEPITKRVFFDINCQNNSWNTTVRIYDEDWNEVDLELSDITFCTGQFLNQSNVTWKVNISANEVKNYYLYYSPNKNVTDPKYNLFYNTSSWIPSNRDEWTDNISTNFSHWSRQEGASGTITNDTSAKKRGNSSVNISDSFSSNSLLGLKYDPTDNITGVTNDWYLDVWLYLDDASGLSSFKVVVEINSTNYINVNISGNISDATWYNFVKMLNPNQWTEVGTFDASDGINSIYFNISNSSVAVKTLKVDGLHFKKKPPKIKIFPEEQLYTISSTKFSALKNISYTRLRKTFGEGYKFRVEVAGDSTGGNINVSSNIACHESPKLLQNRNGTISKVMAKTCIWK